MCHQKYQHTRQKIIIRIAIQKSEEENKIESYISCLNYLVLPEAFLKLGNETL